MVGLPQVTYVKTAPENAVTFSVCSLVRDQARYDVLLRSFAAHGFTPENSEFLAADNRDGNLYDGYDWHRALHARCRGEYVIYCHEDVELIGDGFDELLVQLRNLDGLDPNWLLAGLAGGTYRPLNHGRRNEILRISDTFGNDRSRGEKPGRVETLDELLIVMRRTKPVESSYDLAGFHLYGADLCLQAEFLGGSCYVLDFHLMHHGTARRGPPFHECRAAFIKKYRRFFPARHLHSTVGHIPLGGGWEE